MFNNVTIVGVGLISGSFAIALKEKGFAKHIIGVSRTEASAKKAMELGIIDEALPLEEAVKKSDFIYVAIPVDATIPVMKQIMDLITDKQIVADAGSTKYVLCEALKDHPMRKRFVATHPWSLRPTQCRRRSGAPPRSLLRQPSRISGAHF